MKRYLLLGVLMTITCISFAQKAEENVLLNLKGQAITTIDRNIIIQNYGRTLAQLLNEQPGIVINGAYQPAGSLTNIYMEGTIGGRALILLNGIPVWDPSTIPDYFDLNTISLYELDRIDIYHSTQSCTMGNGAFAGAINLITNQREYSKHLEVSGLQSFGNQGTVNSHIKLWGQKNKWKYTASYSRISTYGFSLAYDSAGNNGFDKDGFVENILNTNVEYTASDHLKLKAYCLYSQYKADSDADCYYDATNFYYDDKQLITGTGFRYQKNKSLLVGEYKYTKTTRDYTFDENSGDRYQGASHFAELYYQTPISTKTTLLVGTNVSTGFFRNVFFDNNFGYGYHFYPTMNSYSLYSKLSYLSKDSSLAVDLAGRAYHHSTYGFVFNYNLSGTYQLKKGLELFAGIAQGTKSPCLFQLYNNYGIGNPNLTPEQTIDYHIGISLQQKNFTQRLRLFYNDLSNLIYVHNDTGIYMNFSKQQTWGFQYELDWKINKAFSINANYAFVDGNDYTKSRENFIDTVTYPYLIRRPQHVINMGIHYASKYFHVGFTGRYISDYHEVGFDETAYTISHFFIMNAYTSLVINKHLQLFANAQNILNCTFFDVKGYNSIPLLVNGGISFKW